MQLFIADELLADVRRRGRPSGSVHCVETDAGVLFVVPRGRESDVAELYPGLRAARATGASRIVPFVVAEVPGGPGPWPLQPALSLLEVPLSRRWVAERLGLPRLPADYQPYLETALERGRNGLLVVGHDEVSFIRSRSRLGQPPSQWMRVPMSVTPIALSTVGEGPLVSGRRFVLVGAGSLGSRAAELLAAAGAAEIVLIDPDVLETRNLRRHLCGVEHLGRPKAEAVADTLHERGFPTTIVAIQGRAQVELADQVRAFVAASDLVLCTTDSAAPRQFVNHAALHAGVPSVIANVQLRPQPLAEIVITVPGGGGCWNCWRTELERDGLMEPPAGHDPADYPDANAPTPSGLPMYQLTAVASAACDLAGVALAEQPQSMKWLMALDRVVDDFPGLAKPRIACLEGLEQLRTCEVCAQ